jgi:hypothetical protein
MNQFVQMYKDSNARMILLMDALLNRGKKPDILLITAAQREYEDQIKQFNVLATLYGVTSKAKGSMKSLEKMNMLDDDTALDFGVAEGEVTIKCPQQGKTIQREDCLDYSGTHHEECHDCEHFKATRDALLGEGA